MSHQIEPAKTGRSRCRYCKQRIAKGELRVSESFVSEWSNDVAARFHHLRCAARSKPLVLRQALTESSLDIANRDELLVAIEQAMRVTDVAQERPDISEEYREFAAMAREAQNDDAVMVFADWLQSVGDPRGELITVQMEKAATDGARRLALDQREQQILSKHARRLVPRFDYGTLVWRGGFVRRIEVTSEQGIVQELLATLLAHPSCLLVDELAISLEELPWSTVTVTPNLPPIEGLRILEVRADNPGALHEYIAAHDGLDTLRVRLGRLHLDALSHARLRTLELTTTNAMSLPMSEQRAGSFQPLAPQLATLTRAQWPNLHRLAIECATSLDNACTHLAGSGLASEVTELSVRGPLGEHGVAAIAAIPGLHTLEIVDAKLSDALADALRDACKVLRVLESQPALQRTKSPDTPSFDGDWLVRHTRKPEWGLGKVLEETDDYIEVEFENAGRKRLRTPELLEDA